MTGLLSAAKADEVRAFAGVRPPPEPSVHPLEAECAALRRDLAEAGAAITDFKRESALAVEAAREEGLKEGRAQAQNREAERLAALGAALETAMGLFEQRLDGLDRLAAELAHAAVERLLGDSDARSAMSASFITRQVQELKRAKVLRARVSGADFGDEAALAELVARLQASGTGVDVVYDPTLKTGQARLECALGQADLDLATQWQSLASLLRDMAR